MNLILRILKPYIGICKHLPVHGTICRYIFEFCFVPEGSSTTRPCRPSARTTSHESSHSRWRGLQMPPARLTRPGYVLNDQLGGLDASPGRPVVSITDADQPLAIACEQLLRACHPRTQRQPDFHRRLSALNPRGGGPCTRHGHIRLAAAGWTQAERRTR